MHTLVSSAGRRVTHPEVKIALAYLDEMSGAAPAPLSPHQRAAVSILIQFARDTIKDHERKREDDDTRPLSPAVP